MGSSENQDNRPGSELWGRGWAGSKSEYEAKDFLPWLGISSWCEHPGLDFKTLQDRF